MCIAFLSNGSDYVSNLSRSMFCPKVSQKTGPYLAVDHSVKSIFSSWHTTLLLNHSFWMWKHLVGKYSKSLVEPLSRALRKAALIGFYRGCNHHKVEDKEENCWNCAEQNHTLLLSKLPTTYFHNLNKKFVLSLPINLSRYLKMLTGIGFGGLQAKTVCLFVGLHHKLGQKYTHAQVIARSEAI